MSNSPEQVAAHGVNLFLLPSRALRTGHGLSWLAYVGIREQTRAAEFKNPEDALNFAAQHTLMRCMLASALEVKPREAADIPVDRSCQLCDSGAPHGKPRVGSLEFSMSRSTGMVAGGITRSPITLGVDIERIKGAYFAGFDRIALSPVEKETVTALQEEHAHIARHLLWTAKEAVLKATGHGLVAGPSMVQLDLADFPTSFEQAEGLAARARLSLEGEQARDFWVSWLVRGEFVVAIATDSPHTVSVHEVAAPLAVRQVLEPGFSLTLSS